METDFNERIDRFLREQMSPEENEAFLRDLETDDALRKEAQLRALMIQELHDRQARQDADIIAEVVADKKAARKTRVIRMLKWVGSVAAVLLLVFGVHTFLSDSEHGTDYIALADKYYDETPEPTFRSGLTDADKELYELFRQVRESHYNPPVRHHNGVQQSLHVRESCDMTPVISRLQAIYDHRDSEYAYQVNGNDVRIAWYLALAYLKNNQPDKAAGLLRVIIQDDKGTDLADKAKELLKRMKNEE